MATTPWPRGNYLNLASSRNLIFFSGAVVVQHILNYCMQNFVYLVIGKSFGEKTLGIYSIAVMLITLPHLVLGVIVDSVFFSAFSRLQDENERLAAAFLKANAFTSVVSVPYFILLFSFAKEMMHAVTFLNHGDAWLPAAILIKILALLGLFFIFSSFTTTLWLAKGKVKLRIYWEMAGFLTIVIAVFAGKPLGINGTCSALVIGGIFLFPLYLIITNRVIGLRPFVFIKILLPSIICGMGMLAFTVLFSGFIPGDSFARDVWTLLVGSMAGMALYSMLLFLFFKNALKSFFEIILLIKGIRFFV
jgi:O-antigen/teichoic acid export membrane protein